MILRNLTGGIMNKNIIDQINKKFDKFELWSNDNIDLYSVYYKFETEKTFIRLSFVGLSIIPFFVRIRINTISERIFSPKLYSKMKKDVKKFIKREKKEKLEEQNAFLAQALEDLINA